jgi:hypothetical protein
MATTNSELSSSIPLLHQGQPNVAHDNNDDDAVAETDLFTLFNELLIRFERTQKSDDATIERILDVIEEIANTVLNIEPKRLLDPRIVQHPLLQFLRKILIDILDHWRASDQRLNIKESDIFLNIILIFVHAADQATASQAEDSRKKIYELLATHRFLNLISDQIIDNVLNKDEINDDPNICALGLLTINLLKGCPFYRSAVKNERLIDNCEFLSHFIGSAAMTVSNAFFLLKW